MKLITLTLLSSLVSLAHAEPSTCYGTPAQGRLENGVSLAPWGDNFTRYSHLGGVLDRTYVHSAVKTIVEQAYQALLKSAPSKTFKYAETGHQNGGPFPPHKTHQNGLSVDFMVPVLDEDGHSTTLPTHLFNRFGYDIEFDEVGSYEEYRLDFAAMAAHLMALHQAAKAQGYNIQRVIFAPELQGALFKAPDGAYVKRNIAFMPTPAWVRHDEHYHVDFAIACKKMP